MIIITTIHANNNNKAHDNNNQLILAMVIHITAIIIFFLHTCASETGRNCVFPSTGWWIDNIPSGYIQYVDQFV